MKRYDSYKDSGVKWLGEIPSHWEMRKAKFLWKESFAVSETGKEELLSVSQYDGVLPAKADTRSESLKGYKKVSENDLVINIMLAWLGGLGVSKYEGLVSPAYCTYKLIHDSDPRFLHYLYKTPLYLAEFARHSTGVVPSRWRMYTDDFGQVLTLLPPIKEQKAISNYLDATTSKIDAAIAQQQKMIDLLNERKQIIINNAVTKGLDPNVKMKPSGVDWIGDIPKHWEIRKFKTVSKVKSNLVHPYDFLSYPQISPDNIEKNTGVLINYNSVKESGIISDNHLFYKGQLIYSKIRPTLNKVIIAPFDGLCSADMYPIVSELNSDYLLFQMLSSFFNNQVQLLVNDRVKMPKINKEELGGVLLIVPPMNEQFLIADYIKSKISDIRNSLMHFETIISLLQERKQIIINDVVTGKVKVV